MFPGFSRNVVTIQAKKGRVMCDADSGQVRTGGSVDGTSADMWGGGVNGGEGVERGAWLKDSRFALFVHWGLYSQLAGEWQGRPWFGISEWIMYRARIPADEYAKLAETFNPTGFDAREWVRLAKVAGMRHIMITAKHHEGFAMFGSEVSPYNIKDATPFGRDPLLELAEACREEGLRLGFYYSQTLDWHEPDAVGNGWDSWPEERDFRRYLRTKVMPQLEELLTRYGPIAGIWFDTPGPITPEESEELVGLVHRLQPDCLVNSRIGNGLGDYDTLGDQEIPRLPRPGLWETPDTHNDTWAFSRYDTNWKSPREVAERLVRVASRGGTYLLNVGPDGKGRIPARSAAILREVGEWVRAHADAIHGVDPTPFGPLPWGECTARGKTLFLHVFDWPADGRLVVPGLHSHVLSACLYGGDRVGVASLGQSVVLSLPQSCPDTLIPVVTLELDSAPDACDGLYVLSGCTNALEPAMALCAGCALDTVRWMEKFGDWQHAEFVGNWSGPDATATWTFDTVESGVFRMVLEYTCPESGDGAAWSLCAGDTELVVPTIDTGERAARAGFAGDFPRFRCARIGVVEVPGPGTVSVVLRPLSAEGAAVRVSRVWLEPLT
jgi:alpha-L-fucosidase